MQNIIIDKPYRFVPPKPGRLWPRLMRCVLPAYLNQSHGIESYELLGVDRLTASVEAGHGIMLTPNHCRPCDPMVVSLLSGRIGRPLNTVASWHLFMQNRLLTWVLPRMGAFSIYREGMDREALKCAIQILTEARRPLVLFPEGVITRTNDRLNHLMDGTAFIAHSAAKQRADTYLAQQLAFYPPEYFGEQTTPDQMLETVERYEEDLTDKVHVHRPLHAAVEVGEAIEASPVRARGAEVDPVMAKIREQLETMLARLKTMRPAGRPGQRGHS